MLPYNISRMGIIENNISSLHRQNFSFKLGEGYDYNSGFCEAREFKKKAIHR